MLTFSKFYMYWEPTGPGSAKGRVYARGGTYLPRARASIRVRAYPVLRGRVCASERNVRARVEIESYARTSFHLKARARGLTMQRTCVRRTRRLDTRRAENPGNMRAREGCQTSPGIARVRANKHAQITEAPAFRFTPLRAGPFFAPARDTRACTRDKVFFAPAPASFSRTPVSFACAVPLFRAA